jgi:hypothetical protein
VTVLIQASYNLPVADEPLCNARIAHSGNWLDGGTATASSTDSDYFEDAPTNTLTYEKWKPNGTSSETWEYDHGSAATCNYCAIAGHTIGTSGATIQVGYHDGSTWSNLIPAQTVSDNGPIFCIFAPTTAQRWRIAVDGAAPTVGVVKFGLALQMPQDIYAGHTPAGFSQQPIRRTNFSEAGETLGTAVSRRYSQNTYAWDRLPHWWMTANWTALQRALETDPIWIAWRPISYPDVSFGMVEETPIPETTGLLNFLQTSITVRSLGYD